MPKPSTNSAIIMQTHPDSPASEAYRSLRFNIDSVFDRHENTIAVSSAGRGEGKTTTATNLAVAYAQIGKKVLLIDADLRHPSIHLSFGGENRTGLTSFLTNQCTINLIIRDSHIQNLSVIVSGPIPPNPSELLASKQMELLLAELTRNYDLIIVDTSPILASSDAKIMAARSDGVLLVVEYGKLKRNVAKKVKEELLLTKTKLLGVAMSKIHKRDAEAYF
jgi:capsular exopolysaccharide synthesis family protein